MINIAIAYSFNSIKSAKIAQKIADNIKNVSVENINAESCRGLELLKYDGLILSVPTWFDGELPNYWDELLPDLDQLNFKGKKVALFGLGDQKNYPENFCDAVGILAEIFEKKGADLVGYTSISGYNFESSKAQRNDHFCGLLLDQENQSKMTDERIIQWINQLESEFEK